MLKRRLAVVLLITILVSNFLFVSEADESPEWTFMVYLAADNDLENHGIDDFLEMASVGSTYDVNILVQFDRSADDDTRYGDWNVTKRFFVEKGMEPTASNAVQDLGEVDMTDSQELYAFLNWSATNYPAKKYYFVIWDHGSGWEWVVTDDQSGGTMKLPELAQALGQFYAVHGRKIDVIAFDACQTMLEMAYDLRNYADHIVGSEKDVPDRGFPYNTLLEAITTNANMPPLKAAQTLVDVYVDFYTSNTIFAVTLSSVESALLDDLRDSLNALLNETLLELPYYSQAIKDARDATESYDGNNQFDLYHFLENLQVEVSSRRLQELAEGVKTVIEDSVYSRKWDNPSSANSRATHAHGMTIWLPTSLTDYNYLNLQFANHTYWDEFLKQYYIGYPKPQATLDIDYTSSDANGDGITDTISLTMLSNISGNLSVEFYSNDFQFSQTYTLNADVPETDTISLTNNGYYTLHFYLTNTTGHLQNYLEIINPLLSFVDLEIDVSSIIICPYTQSAPIGVTEVIKLTIINYGTLDALGVNVSFYTSHKSSGESPDENEDGKIDPSYSGRLIGWTIVDIYADSSNFKSRKEVSITWDTSDYFGQNDIWILVDYDTPGVFPESEEILNNKAGYLQCCNFYSVEPRNFTIYGTIVNDKGAALELNLVLVNLMTEETIPIRSTLNGFEVSIWYPTWAGEGDTLELDITYKNKDYKFKINPDFTESSYAVNIVLEEDPDVDETDGLLIISIILIQLVAVIIAIIGFFIIRKR